MYKLIISGWNKICFKKATRAILRNEHVGYNILMSACDYMKDNNINTNADALKHLYKK